MELFIYSDESGVFDKEHNEFFTYGGIILIGREQRDIAARKYRSIEKDIARKYDKSTELKASVLKNKEKNRLYKGMFEFCRFGAIIDEQGCLENIYAHKQSKQRYLDYVFKISLKNAFINMEREGIINFDDIMGLNVFVDEHTTATDGKYELREGLLQEFKIGTFNYHFNRFFPPIFKNLVDVKLKYCNSANVPLVRSSDIIANRVFWLANNKQVPSESDHIYIKEFP